MSAKTIILRTSRSFDDPDNELPILQRDAVIAPGVLWCVDLARSYSWLGGNPTNGADVRDLTYNAANSTANFATGTPTLSGGGFDLTGSDLRINVPTAAFGSLFTNQEFLICIYVKLPVAGDWYSGSNPKGWISFASASHIASVPDLVNLAAYTSIGSPVLTAFRQRAVGTYNGPSIIGATVTPFQGTVTQFACWRNAAGVFTARWKNATNTASSADTVNIADNSADFSTNYGSFGVTPSATTALDTGGKKSRIYRAWIEDLSISGRNPEVVLDADWTRTAARGVFS
jgi:hypothetical protein